MCKLKGGIITFILMRELGLGGIIAKEHLEDIYSLLHINF